MKAPRWDQDFPNHNIHGMIPQEAFIRRAARHCKQRRFAIDVGAHIGLTANALAKSFDKVLAFEPIEENFQCLVSNAKNNVIPMRYALFDSEMFGHFEMPEGGNSGCWRLTSVTGDSAKVPMFTLDSFEYLDIDFIKLDTEGTEGMVLDGARDTIEYSKPVIVFEDNGLGEKYYGSQWLDPKTVLSELGYEHVERIFKDEVWKHRS